MNIALGALIIVLLLLPAISFKFGTRRNVELNELLEAQSVTDAFWAFLFVPVLINLLLLPILHKLHYHLNFDLLFKLIIGDKDLKIFNSDFYYLLMNFLIYILICFVVGYLLGYLAANIGSNNRFLSKFLNLEDKWARLTDLDSLAVSQNKQIDLIYVDILANNKENTVIYSGLLSGFFYKTKSKELDYILLSNVYRRDLHKEHITEKSENLEVRKFDPNQGGFYSIPGDLFIIPSEQILNINFRYIDLNLPTP